MQIDRIDHFVLTARNIEATCKFYARVLGMQVVTFAGDRKALQFGQQKINLHEAGKEFEPKAKSTTPGSGDFCLITQTSLEEVIVHIRSCGIEIVEGPVHKTGATGPIESVYLRDP